MSEISARPWYITKNHYNTWDINNKNNLILSDVDESYAQHIVKCVNEHDALVAEVERLKEIIKNLKGGAQT